MGLQPAWQLSYRADPVARDIADRHYNRQSPGSAQFVPPGRCLVLRDDDCPAVWVTSWPFAEYVKHQWAWAWVNSLFRKEGEDGLASDMIRAAVSATIAHFGDPPTLGMITFVDAKRVRPQRFGKARPGHCYKAAGFRHVGFTKSGLWAWQMLPADMPAPIAAIPRPLEAAA